MTTDRERSERDPYEAQQFAGLRELGYPQSPAATAGSEPLSPARKARLRGALAEIQRFRPAPRAENTADWRDDLAYLQAFGVGPVARVLVCGDRKWADEELIAAVLKMLLARQDKPYTVVSGGARGADDLAVSAAIALGLPAEIVPADWKKHGRAAGPIRNRKMLDTKPDLVFAFHDDIEHSKGTKDCATEARRRGIPVRVIRHPVTP